MNKEDLNKLTVTELAAVCKKNNIPRYVGKNLMKKSELVLSILKTLDSGATVDFGMAVETVNPQTLPQADKQMYIDNLKPDTLVAFREYSGRLNTAAVKEIDHEKESVTLITQYEKEFIINFKDIVWIRTGKRWPKFVMSELKDVKRNEQRSQKTDNE
jgi:hypothetical protein